MTLRMKLIDKYLSRLFFVPLFYCLSAFVILFIAYRLSEQLDRFIEREIATQTIVMYYLYSVPVVAVLSIPFATLLALLYCLGLLSRHNEIIAMRASGIALFRIVRPYIIIGAILSVVTFTVSEIFVPPAKRMAADVEEAAGSLRQALHAGSTAEIYTFHNSLDNRQWLVRGRDTVSNILHDVHIMQYSHAHSRQKKYKIEARQAEHIDGFGWLFYDVTLIRYFRGRDAYPAQKFRRYHVTYFPETPEHIFSPENPEMMNIREITREMRHMHPDSDRYLKLRMERMARISGPFACFVFILLASPFGISHTRAGMIKGVITSILLCLSYYVFAQFLITLGDRGLLTPLIAAWLPIATFTGIGFYLLYRMR